MAVSCRLFAVDSAHSKQLTDHTPQPVVVVGAVVPVPDPPAVSPGEGAPPGVFLVAPAVVPGVEDGAAFGLEALGSPSSVGPQPATTIATTKAAKRTVKTLFIPPYYGL